MYKVVKNLSAPIMSDILENQNNVYQVQCLRNGGQKNAHIGCLNHTYKVNALSQFTLF